jgi:diguanylate cyclase
MGDESAAASRLPVPLSAVGPLYGLVVEVRELANSGRCQEALALLDVYEWIARAFGDDKTVGFLIQRRMYVYLFLRHYDAALAVGEGLLERHRSAGNVLGEAKTLADLAELCVLAGRLADGMRYLARAGLLLENTTRRNDRYQSALCSYADAATVAELYEIADSAYGQLAGYFATLSPPQDDYFDRAYSGLLVSWALRLEQLGHTLEATRVMRRAEAIVRGWLARAGATVSGATVSGATVSGDTVSDEAQSHLAVYALILAKLGMTDRAITVARRVVVGLRAQDLQRGAMTGHLALGVALRARGDFAAARRELLAAQQLWGSTRWADGRLIVAHELAALAAEAHGNAGTGDLVETIREQAGQLWQQRLQRLSMLRQARRQEELEIERTQAEAALLHDPLTGLGNRRRFDQLMAAIDAGQLPGPTSLLLIDVDKFKAINDTYSHTAGDHVLRELAEILRSHCRRDDVPIRYAGDEFTVFLRADRTAAVEIAESIRIAVAGGVFDHIPAGAPVTVSIGVAALQPRMSATDLFHATDRRLYQAKRAGRDRVVG